jgi:ribonuclease III
MTAQTGRDPGPGPAPSASAGCSPESIEHVTGHRFEDEHLLTRALTHASVDAARSNERLEFLGDRVLGLVVAEALHALYPEDSEGRLALKLNALVRQEACARAAQAAGLGPHLILGKSETRSGGRGKPAILACACEAVIAALYLDGGMDAARAFVERWWADQFAALSHDMRDAKTALQEWAQARKGGEPQYRETGRSGPDHAPHFRIEVTVSGVEPQTGEGRSKREAEQDAAKKMLDRIS